MIDYKTFKKGYLNEWVDKSQAARKAAEELAKREVRPSLRDLHKNDFNEELVFTLDGHDVEFKGENEKNPDDPKYNFFTYEEAMERFGKPNKDGWRLPTEEELHVLYYDYPYMFDKVSEQGVFDGRLYLPAMGLRGCSGNVIFVGSEGYYWSSTPEGSDNAWYLNLDSGGKVYMYSSLWCSGFSVRLVRDIK